MLPIFPIKIFIFFWWGGSTSLFLKIILFYFIFSKIFSELYFHLK